MTSEHKWTPWGGWTTSGRGYPDDISIGEEVMVVRRNGSEDGPYPAGRIAWQHDMVSSDIMFYRPHERPAYNDAVVALLNHLEDVLDDANWDKVSVKLWNAVSMGELRSS